MTEQELNRIAARLGADAARAMHPERTAEAVVHRLRTEPPQVDTMPRRWWRAGWVRAVAAALIVVTAGLVTLLQPPTANLESNAAAPPVLDDLSADELDEVLDSLTMDGPVVNVGFFDLTEAQLEELLTALEG